MYLINNIVEFNPKSQTLFNRISGKCIQIQFPATQCLLYLITQYGDVVSQNTLLKVGWGDRNDVTTPNTFYQTILILRNSLSDVGLSRETIKTIARRGLILGDDVQIKRIENQEPCPVDDPVCMPPTSKNEVASNQRYKTVCFYGFFVVFIFIAWVGLLRHSDSAFKHYVPLAVSKELSHRCHLYSSGNELTPRYYSAFINAHPELCVNQYHIFITGYRQAERISAFVCRHDPRIVEDTFCATHYAWRKSE